jgi:ATP-dependent Clp protease ATP-binding subunit ClpB
MLDDGRLTDSHGKTVDFRNTVIIMTSNVGAHGIMEFAGDRAKMDAVANEALKAKFRPEFLNRIDDIVIYNPLSRDHIGLIVDIQMKHLEKLLAHRNMSIELTEGAKILLGDLGFDPAYGARPLKRAILRNVKDPLSTAILEGRFGEGDHIQVDADGERLTFVAAPRAVEGDDEVVEAELVD